MASESEGTILGRCPLCDSRLPAEQLVVSYSPAEGWPQMLAACRQCDAVVGPR